jgi:biotin carboxyl carrier protein
MDLTNEDVADVLALLDSLPYDELDLQTARFRLVLRRTPDGWTQAVQTRSAPNMLDASAPGAVPGPGASGSPGPDASGAPATAPMTHRGGYNRSDGPSGRSGSNADGADETEAATGALGPPLDAGAPGPPGPLDPGASEAAPSSLGPGASGAAPMEHRRRYSDTDVPSVSLGEGADLADREADGASGESGELDDGLRERLGGESGLVAVRAPLPGTFYRAPRPGAAPFVEVGSRVDPDTVVGIVETMKLMNSVTAGVAGAVAEICLGNAEFAAHGATLLRIRAD